MENVKARSPLCYWAVTERGMALTGLAIPRGAQLVDREKPKMAVVLRCEKLKGVPI